MKVFFVILFLTVAVSAQEVYRVDSFVGGLSLDGDSSGLNLDQALALSNVTRRTRRITSRRFSFMSRIRGRGAWCSCRMGLFTYLIRWGG